MSSTTAAPQSPELQATISEIRRIAGPVWVVVESLQTRFEPGRDALVGEGLCALAMRAKDDLEKLGPLTGEADGELQDALGLLSAMALAAVQATSGKAETTEGPNSLEAEYALYVLAGIARRRWMESTPTDGL